MLYAILRYRAEKLIEAPPYVAREDDNGDFEAVPHELDTLFREPNPDDDWQDIATVTQWLLDLDGSALWTKHRDTGNRTRIVRAYSAHEFEVSPGEDALGRARLYGSFRVQHQDGPRTYAPEDVVYFRLPHPYDRQRTMSPTDAVLGMLGIAGDLRERVKATLRNAAVPGGFFVLPEGVTRMGDEEFARTKMEVQTQFQRANSGRPGLLEGGMTFQRTALGLNDIQFGELWREVEAACCAAFSVRPEVLGFLVGLENAPWSHMQVARRLVYEDSAIPTWNRWSRTLSRQLLDATDRSEGLSVQFDQSRVGVLKEDVDRMSRVAVRMGDDLSVNERRIMIGKEPTTNPEHDIVRGREDTRRQSSEPETEPPPIKSGPAIERKDSDPERVKAWKEFDSFATSQEAQFRRVAQELLAEDRDWALSIFDEEAKGWAKLSTKETDEARIRRILARLDREYREAREARWLGALGTPVQVVSTRAARRAAERLAIDFALMTPGVDAFALEHAAELVRLVTETTKTGIRLHLAAGLRNGEGIPEIRDRIASAGVFAPSRAELIARTEATSVVNGAQVEALEFYQAESGNRIRKQWLATMDERTRDEHWTMDGQEVGVDEYFDTPDLGLVMHPSAPNCRCTLTYRLVREGEE